MDKILMYDKYDETYREVIDVKELREYILKRIEEIENEIEQLRTEKNVTFDNGIYKLTIQKEALQSFLKDLEVEDD